MPQQILLLHGGKTYDSHDDYLEYLNSVEIGFEKIRFQKNWKYDLADELGSDFDVLTPTMPNAASAHYNEWKIWLEKILKLCDENIILIGHSLGGIFLVKYLAENTAAKKIKATIIVAAPYDAEGCDQSLGDFILPPSLDNLSKQGGKIYLFLSKDDPQVPFVELDKYKKALPEAQALVFDDRGHFLIEKFPELVNLIKGL